MSFKPSFFMYAYYKVLYLFISLMDLVFKNAFELFVDVEVESPQ